MKIYDFQVVDMDEKEVSLDEYKGKVLLIVNTATRCGFTPQYEGLEKLYQKYQEQGFVVLGFPCNQFLNQAPEDNEAIKGFCSLNYGITFPQFAKIKVNGDKAHPLYKFLKEEKPRDLENPNTSGFLKKIKKLGVEPLGSAIRWNFTKFLIDREGNVVERYAPLVEPEELEEAIEKLL